ncbi:MAG: S8 family peptidase [Bacteroidetes bacterium]|nr:S8 family peptidase [Bacteroidota bacterium]
MKTVAKLFYFVAFLWLLQSCGSVPAILSTPIQNIDNTPIKTTEIPENDLKRWNQLDLVSDTIPGMSVDKAYIEILGNLKGQKVIVAVVDSGVDINHEDLKAVIWTNKDEIPNNGKDDDKNGYVDDVHGWNFLGKSIHETLEMTRVVRRYKTRFEGKTESQISAQDKADYADYERAKATLETKIKELQGPKQQLDFIVAAEQTLKDALDKESFTKEDVQNLKSQDNQVLQARNVFMQILSRSTKEEFDEEIKSFKEYVYGQLNYNLNLEFDGREVVGDDPYNFNDRNYGDNDVTGPSEDKEDIKHGTHVAGIIGAVRNNGIGMDGVSNLVEIMPLRAVPDGDEYDKDIALAIRYAVDNGAKVINASFGKAFSPNREWVDDALKYAASKDVLFVHAAGNDGLDLDDAKSYNFPNDAPHGSTLEYADNVITIGAIGPKYGADIVAGFSNYGKTHVDVFAPGVKIWATTPNNTYEYLQGTSMAAPAIAGLAALIRAYFPKLTASQVKKIIMDSGLPINQVVVVPESDDTKPFAELSRSGKIANAYNALILASQVSRGLK